VQDDASVRAGRSPLEAIELTDLAVAMLRARVAREGLAGAAIDEAELARLASLPRCGTARA
jgi:hypothetical protein